jgi:hypothetical protein
MFGSALLLQGASAVLSLALLLVISASAVLPALEQGNEPTGGQVAGLLVGATAVLLVNGLLSTFGTMLLQGALVVPVARSVLDRRTRFTQMWRLAAPRIGSLLVLALLYAAATVVLFAVVAAAIIAAALTIGNWAWLLGFLLLAAVIVGVVFTATKLLLAPAAMIVEDLPVFAAIRRSWDLTAGNWWRTFGTYLLAQIIAGAVGGALTVPITLLIGLIFGITQPNPGPSDALRQQLLIQGISIVLGTLIGAVTLAFQAGVLSLIYMDLRMRKEGFDIVLMKEHERDAGTNPDGIPGRIRPPAAPFQAGTPFPAGTLPAGAFPAGAPGTGMPFPGGPFPGTEGTGTQGTGAPGPGAGPWNSALP